MPILSYENSDWFLVTTVIKNQLTTSRVVDLGRKFTSPYLIIRVNTKGSKGTWSFGGKLWATNLVLGQQAKFYEVDLNLFGQELLIVPVLFTGKYSLLYEAPKYFLDVTLKVWEYKGTVNSGSDLSSIASSITTLSDAITNQAVEINQVETQLEQLASTINQKLDALIIKVEECCSEDEEENPTGTAPPNDFENFNNLGII
jgi:uncharacterized coiled-coil protein SlyX